MLATKGRVMAAAAVKTPGHCCIAADLRRAVANPCTDEGSPRCASFGNLPRHDATRHRTGDDTAQSTPLARPGGCLAASNCIATQATQMS